MNLFIKKLIKEGKIKLTNPSKEVSEAYAKKSKKSLISASALLNIGNYEDATVHIYFSMYNIVLALLFKCGIKSENHTGTIIILKELFNMANKDIQKAKDERIDKQYTIESKSTKKDVTNGIILAEQFNARIQEKIDKLKELDIAKIRGNLIK